jgi:hypothetical protein
MEVKQRGKKRNGKTFRKEKSSGDGGTKKQKLAQINKRERRQNRRNRDEYSEYNI